MTVCVAVKVRDCIVFGADSALSMVSTTPGGSSQVPIISNIWNHGIKVFNLHKKLPIVAMSAGLAHFGPVSITNLAKDLRQHLTGEGDPKLEPTSYTMKEVTEKADDFIFSNYQLQQPPPANPHTFEFWIGDYGSSAPHGEIWKLTIKNGQKIDPQLVVRQEDDSYVIWGGSSVAINRLILGLDGSAHEMFVKAGVDASTVNRIQQTVTTPLVDAAMPVQDAIDLVDFLVDLEKRYSAFRPGADVVGGDTDIATVTKHEGFKWIRRKHYYQAHFNRMETDHA